MTIEESWAHQAACRGLAVERGYDLFYEEDHEAEAKSVCAGCDVRVECLHEAITQGIWYGIYGGLTPRERESHYRKWRRRKTDKTVESLLQWNEAKVG